jgi:hypothetical protein
MLTWAKKKKSEILSEKQLKQKELGCGSSGRAPT